MTAKALQKLLQSMFRGDRRRAGRYAVGLGEAVVTGQGGTQVTIRDLSLTGALIEGAELPAAGTVTLTHGTLHIAAAIAWSDGGRAGLQFDRPLPVEQLFTIVHSAQFRRGEGVPAALAA
jgi:PilZ domain